MKKNKSNYPVQLTHVEKLTKPFEYEDVQSITEFQYEQSCNLGNRAAIYEYALDYQDSFSSKGCRYFINRLYDQLDIASANAIGAIIDYTTKVVLALFFEKIDTLLKDKVNENAYIVITNTVCGKITSSDVYVLPNEIRTIYNNVVRSQIIHIINLYMNKEIGEEKIEQLIEPFMTIFSSRVVSHITETIFNGIYTYSTIYRDPKIFNILNSDIELITLLQELGLNIYNHFSTLTSLLIQKELESCKIYKNQS